MSAHASASLERFCSPKLAVERLRRFSTKRHKATRRRLQSIPRHDPRLLQRWRSRPFCGERTGVATYVRGLRDAVLDGWFRSETGELLAGFAIGPGHPARSRLRRSVATLFAARQGLPVIFTDSEEGQVRSLAQQVEAVAQRPSPAWSATATRYRLRDACADKLVCM